MSVDEAVQRVAAEHATLLEAVRLRTPKAWGALAAAGVIAFRDQHGRAPTDAERRAIWAALWQRATAQHPEAAMASRRVVVITGGSRGIGAATARELARRHYDVAFTYRNKTARASEVAADIENYGGAALAVKADITDRNALRSFAKQARGWRPRVDLLILNASGGLERDLVEADAEYAMRINRDAQLATLDAVLSLMPDGSTVLFVTSHWAHLYGAVPQLPNYEPIAHSKHAGEQALRSRIGELAKRRVRLLVVTGDLVEGTITARLLERRSRGLHDARVEESVTPEQFANAIADAALDASLVSGATVVVGGALASVQRDVTT